jgi:hypothetical protein
MERQEGDEDCGQNLNGDLDMERIEQPSEDAPFPSGLVPAERHDPLFEAGGRLHLVQVFEDPLRLLELPEGTGAAGARGEVSFDLGPLPRGEEILHIG